MVFMFVVFCLGGWMLPVALGADIFMAHARRLEARNRLEASAWAVTEEWTPCRRCGAPARPGAPGCADHGGPREEVHC